MNFIERLNEGRTFSPACAHPNGLASALRITPPVDVAAGFEDAFLATSEFLLTVKQIDARKTFDDSQPGLGRLVFIFHLDGRREIELDHSGRHELSRPTFAAYYQAKGVAKRSIWTRGEKERSVLIGFWTGRPPRLLHEALQYLPGWAEMHEGRSKAAWATRPLNFAMEQAAYQILNPQIQNLLLSDFLTLKATELLFLGLDAMLADTERTELGDEAVRSKILYAQGMLDSALTAPPSQADLARSVDLPATDFAAVFRGVTGMTVSQYLNHRRMQKARMLIDNTAMPLKQIAYETGYNHTSNLCLAIKRHFGRTAREMRADREQSHLPFQ